MGGKEGETKSRKDLFIKNYNNWQSTQFSLQERSSVRFKSKVQTTIFGYPYSAIINCFCFIKMLGDTVMDI